MKKARAQAVFILLFLFFNCQTAALFGQEAVFNQRISLDLRNIDVIEAFKFLSQKVGINIITTKSVSGRVSLSVEDALFRDVFDIMLRSNGLAYARQGDIYNIMTEPEYRAFYGENFLDMRLVKPFRLKYSIPEQAFNLLDALKSGIGRVVVDSENGNVLVMDTSDKISQMEKAIEEFEKRNLVNVFSLKYAKAKEVEDVLKSQLDSKKAGYIMADERNNQIVVQTFPDRMDQISELVEKLDRQTKEVMIETKIIKVKLTDQFDNGIEWEGIFKVATDHGATYAGTQPFSVLQESGDAFQSRKQFLDNVMLGEIDAYPFSGNTSDFSSSTKTSIGEKLHFGIVDGKRDFDILYKLLQTMGKTRLLANPKLVAVNNQEAKIHIGEKQAYVTTTTSTGSTTNTISEEVTFVDVGIQLAVTPTINDDGYITMKIKPEISSVSSTLVTPTGNKIPIIDTTLTETTVMMKDNTTLVIGGLRRENKVSSSEGLPIISKIPFIGSFFKSGSSTTERNELVIMLTPHIISGMELDTGNEREFGHKPGKEYRDYQSIGDDYRQRLSLPAEEVRPPSQEVPQEIRPKPYQPFEEKEEMQMKELRYEPF